MVPTVVSQPNNGVTISNVNVYPQEVTVADKTATIVANITSQSPIQRVALNYAVTTSDYLNQNFNYTTIFMFPGNVVGQFQYWEAQVPVPTTPSLVAFYVNATNANGSSSVYPSIRNPDGFLVEPLPNATLDVPEFTLNSMTLGLQYSYANLTLSMNGIIPVVTGYPVGVSMTSLPHGYGIFYPNSLSESVQNRFYYSVNGSFTTEVAGQTSNYPYDSYIVGVNMSIDYPNLNVTNYPIRLTPSNQIANTVQDSWNINTIYQGVEYRGNYTIILVEFQLTRSNQPISLPIIAYGTVVLLAAALFFDETDVTKRLTVFLTAIVLALSVLISPNLNPFGFGNTIFEEYFSYLMLATAVLTATSVVTWRARNHPEASNVLEFVVAGGIGIASEIVFGSTALPASISLAPLSIFAVSVASYFIHARLRNRSTNTEHVDTICYT